jgi:hypothetical protein
MRGFGAILTLSVVVAVGIPASASAVSGQAGSGDAAAAQYVQPQQNAGDGEQEVLGDDEIGGLEGTPVPTGDGGETVAAADSGDGSLPFTGYAALLVLAAGGISLILGFALKRLRDEPRGAA